jgi:KipI family sensor histidine kinase inhibitor
MPDSNQRFPEIEAVSESLLIVRLGATIDATLNAAVHALAARIAAAELPGVDDIVPAYASVALRYRAERVRADGGSAFAGLRAALLPLLAAPHEAGADVVPRCIDIPVCYGGAFGVDLDEAATALALDPATLIALHAGADYRVAMLGFAPGFPYLLGLPAELALPRRAQPRLRVPAGSVAIGGAQTGIYPGELPGGWRLIGRTPLRLFDAGAAEPCLLAPGDRVRFQPIDADRFEAWLQGSRP